MGPIVRMAFMRLLIVLLGLVNSVAALDMHYCSSLNTGADFESVFDKFQSYGACSGTCSKFAFGILQGKYCWCSNAAPGDTASKGSCSQNCPGFPSDKCGSGSDLYAYIQLDSKPSTTIGGSTQTTSSSHTVVTSEVGTTSAVDTTQLTVTETPTPSTSSSLTFSSSTLISSSRTETTEPPTTLQTSDGNVMTVTAPGAHPTSDSSSDSDGTSVSPGAIAGIVIGCVAGGGLLIGIAIWWFCFYGRRRRNQDQDDGYNSSFFERTVPRPKFEGTLGSREAALAAAPPVTTNGYGNGYGSPPTQRLSVPAFTDSRLKADAELYPNGSRHSNVSLQDHHDYSRPVLRTTNPDPIEA